MDVVLAAQKDLEHVLVLGVEEVDSASESEYQLLLARDLGYLLPDMYRQLDDQVNEVKRMLNSFIKTLC